MPKADADAARSALKASDDPRVRALAVRVLARSTDAADAALLDDIVDDERSAGAVPREVVPQQMTQCNTVHWVPTTPSREALLVLSRLFGTPFADRAAYRVWVVAHPDPEVSFDVWVGRFAARRPPAPELLARLRASDPLLFVRVMIFTCDGDGGCGLTDAELADAVKTIAGPKRALKWLDQSEKFPEWKGPTGVGHTYRSLLAASDRLFGPAESSALHHMFDTSHFGFSIYHAMLGVLLSRLRPADAKIYFRQLLARHHGFELSPESAAIVLREAVRRDFSGMLRETAEWFFPNGATDAEPHASAAIWEGVSEADAGAAASAFAHLVAKDFRIDNFMTARALHRAAARVGCTGLPPEASLVALPLKNEPKEKTEARENATRAARSRLITDVKACGAALRAKAP